MKTYFMTLAFSVALFPALASAGSCEPGCAPRLCGECLEKTEPSAPEFYNEEHGSCFPTRYGTACTDGCEWHVGQNEWTCPGDSDAEDASQ
jgi:hypothetical protein